MACSFSIFSYIEKQLSRLFYLYGGWLEKNWLVVLCLTLVLAMGLSAGLVFLEQDSNAEKLFTPRNSRAEREREQIEKLFNHHQYTDGVSASRLLTPLPRSGLLIVTAKDGRNILRPKMVEAIVSLYDQVLSDISVECRECGQNYTYQELCLKWEGSCQGNLVIELFQSKAVFSYPFTQLPKENGTEGDDRSQQKWHFIGASLGGVRTVEQKEGNGQVKFAEAVQLQFLLEHATDEADALSVEWETLFVNRMETFRSDLISVTYWTSMSISNELVQMSISAVPRFFVSFLILVVFTVGSCCMVDCVQSQPLVGVVGLLAAMLAISSTGGLLSYCGVKINTVVVAMPFLIIGIGIDDTFIMLASWRRTSPRLSVHKRMSLALSEAALSITITSITDILAFGIGALTDFPSIKVFCLYCGVAIFFAYLYQITFLAPILVLSGRRQARRLNSILCCLSLAPASSHSSRRHAGSAPFKDGPAPATSGRGQEVQPALMKFFRGPYASFLTSNPVRAVVGALFVLYLAFAVWGSVGVQEGISMQNMVADDSYVARFYDDQARHFPDYGQPLFLVLSEPLDYWRPATQRALEEEVLGGLEASPFLHGPALTDSWLRSYAGFLDSLGVRNASRQQFYHLLADDFLQLPAFAHYRQDLVLDPAGASVVASRLVLTSRRQASAGGDAAMMRETRRLVDRAPLPGVGLYHPAFIFYEQFVAVLPNTLHNLAIALACMSLVALLLIPHPLGSLYVTLAIVSIDLGVVGFMTFWGVNLDCISMICIIICIGFSVDFSAHITHAFVVAKGRTRIERTAGALHALGMPIFQGAASTMLAIIILSTSDAYIMRTFFKTMFLVILFGALHALVVLPVLLSLLGPRQPCHQSDQEEANGPSQDEIETLSLKAVQVEVTDSPEFQEQKLLETSSFSTAQEPANHSKPGHHYLIFNPYLY